MKNLKPSETNILDATAGLGSDSFMLASNGFKIIACEKNPITYHLLNFGLKNAILNPQASPIAKRITAVNKDSIDYLKSFYFHFPFF